MKKLMKLAVALLLLVIVGLGALYFYRNTLVRAAVENQATASLGVKTELGGANVGLFGGTLGLSDFKIASPQGYQAEKMFTLGELGLGVNYGQLREDPIRVKQISLDKPKVVIEFANGKFNFQALMDGMGGGASTPPTVPDPGKKPEPAPAPKEEPKTAEGKPPTKLIIDQLDIKDATVEVRHAMLPSPVTVNIPSISLKQIGNADGAKNGAAIKDVVGVTMSALAAAASNSPQLKDISGMLQAQAQQVMNNISKDLGNQVNAISGQVTGEINKAVGDVTKNLPGEVGKVIPGGGDLNKVIPGGKDPGKTVEEGLKGLIPGGEKKKEEKK